MYVSWLQQQHPDDLLYNLSSSTTTDVQQADPPNRNGTNDRNKETESPEQLIAKPSYSLSASLANTGELVTELRDFG